MYLYISIYIYIYVWPISVTHLKQFPQAWPKNHPEGQRENESVSITVALMVSYKQKHFRVTNSEISEPVPEFRPPGRSSSHGEASWWSHALVTVPPEQNKLGLQCVSPTWTSLCQFPQLKLSSLATWRVSAVLVVVLLFLLTYTEPELNWKILSCLFPFLMLWRELWEWELCPQGSLPKHSSKALDMTWKNKFRFSIFWL